MRSFGARADCTVWDEPFFAPFLAQTGKAHPGRAETLHAHETDPAKIAARIQRGVTTPYHFLKNMPHHMLDGFPDQWMTDARHVFLLRHPARVIASYAKGRTEFDIEDLGFKAQRRLFERLTQMLGTPPPVIHSEDILENPKTALTALCESLDIPFDPDMLKWKAGARPEDGAWAPYWYASVEASTTFGPPSRIRPELSNTLKHFHDECLADYEALSKHAIFTL